MEDERVQYVDGVPVPAWQRRSDVVACRLPSGRTWMWLAAGLIRGATRSETFQNAHIASLLKEQGIDPQPGDDDWRAAAEQSHSTRRVYDPLSGLQVGEIRPGAVPVGYVTTPDGRESLTVAFNDGSVVTRMRWPRSVRRDRERPQR